MKRILCAVLALVILLTVSSCKLYTPKQYAEGEANAKLIVHFIDVGQGDSILLESNDEFVLIDAGERGSGDTVSSYINERGADELKYVIATHPHTDHMGGMRTVLDDIAAENFITAETDCATNTWIKLLKTVEEKKINFIDAKSGDTYTFGSASFTILAPNSDSYDGYNNYSVVTKVTCGDISFMLTGDAEKESEYEMVSSGADLRADVLKCGHHGSSTSTTAKFLKAVNPSYAVISCGKDNDYGHPHKETLQKLNALDTTILRTDQMGTVIAYTDGTGLSFSAANNNAVEADFAICSTLGATTVATTPATGDVVTFVATVDNSNDNITGKYFTITYMEGGVEQTFTLENSAVEINTGGNLVGHITETAATPLYGKTLTVVPTITLNSPCSNSEGQSLVYNMPGQTPTPETFTCGDDLTVGTNTYPTVLIGTQCWTKTNMRETVGTQGSESSDTSFTAPYYYVHPTTGEYFYNWSAANQVCPTGWHLPSWEEFNNFLNFLNSRSEYLCDGQVAKAIAAQTGWFLDESTNQCYVNYEPATSNDATGFSALPVGVWNYGGSSHFVLESKSVGFWTSREDNGVAHGENGYLFSLEYNSGDIGYGNNSKLMGFSVRCLLDENSGGGETTQTEPSVTTEPATGVGQTAALLNGTLSNPSNVAITAKGFEWKAVGAGSYTQVSVTASYMSYTLTGLTASSEYIYRAFVTTASGTSYGQEVTFTTAAPPACPVLGTPTFCKQVGTNTVTIIIRTPIENYDADLVSDIIYDIDFSIPMGGPIGSAHASMATDGIVTNIDGNYVCVQEVELDAATWQSNQSLYMDYNRTIEYTSICGGTSSVTDNGSITVYEMPACESGTCPSLGATGTPGVSVSNSVFVTVITAINDYDANKIGLYSYRIYYTDDQYFVKYTDHGASISEAGLKVTFNPSVELPVPYASSVCTLRLVPVLNVICSDTALIGEGVEYVYVPVFNCGTDNVFDVDGNEYATVLIGAQCWMKENLRTKHFPDGISIPVTANDSIFMSSCYYDYTSSSIPLAKRGLLYNWPAAMYGASSSNANPSGVQGVCPNGWHVPSDAEWTQLTDYVSSQSTYRCGTGDNADNTFFSVRTGRNSFFL